MDEDFDGGVNWDTATNAREMTRPPRKEPKIDVAVSKILGKPVLVNDPRLIRLVVEWKKKQSSSADNIDKMDNFLYNPDFLVSLHKTFA